MKILVIRFSSMGDVIIATSLFTYLKNVAPGSSVHFLTDAFYAGLFKDDPRLEAVVGAEKKRGLAGCGGLLDVRWDLVIDLQDNKRSREVLTRLPEPANVRVFNKLHRQRLILLCARLNTYDSEDSVARRYCEAAGFEKKSAVTVPAIRVDIDEAESKRVYASLFTAQTACPLIALFPFSAWKNKEWGRECFGEIGRHFAQKGWEVAVMGGPEERRDAVDLQKKIGPRSLALAGRLSLYECACLLRRCSLAFGNDTGLSHLARACGVKAGVVFGATTHHFGFFPFGDPPFKIFQEKLFCRPCHPHGGDLCLRGDRPCLGRIEPATVIQGLEELASS